MAPLISESKITLGYPLYACDFDPQDANRLIVGGGGGAGRSGVGNRITLLDTSSADTIALSSEIDLSKDEDNVTTLAVGQHKGRSTLVYAGINSSPADQQKGKNEHFRVFGIDQASKAKAATGPKISELARGSLFSTKDADTYQRLLRISPAYPGSAQVGAVATGLSKEPQIALFDVSPAGSAGPKPRGRLDIPTEAMDLDIIQTGDDHYQLAYCDAHEIFLVNIAKGSTDGPTCVFTIPHDESPRPAFRSVRYLTPNFLFAVANIPKQGGVILHSLRLPTAGQEEKARISASARLPKTVNQATGLAVRNLSPVANPTTKQGDAQFVVAVAGHGSSMSFYTVEFQSFGPVEIIANIFPFKTLKDVHPLQITGLAFSTFHVPKTTSRPQVLKLASISIGNTVVVHTIPLRKVIEKSSSARRARPPRYVVGMKSKAPTVTSLLIFIGIAIAILSVLIQGVLEVKGLTRPVLGASKVVPAAWSTPWQPLQPRNRFLVDFLTRHRERGGDSQRLLIREDDLTAVEGKDPRIQVVVHDEKMDKNAKKWDELHPKQQAAWKVKLKKAGQWTEDIGEAIFEDILFSELAGVIGAAVGG